MEQKHPKKVDTESKLKKKKLLIENAALKRDVHKYHTLYEKQKEYYEEKLQELQILESKYRELEHKCLTQEKEIEKLFIEHIENAKSNEMKKKELEAKQSELNSVVNSCQELSTIFLILDKHLQFLINENLIDGGALQIKNKDSYVNTGNRNNCKPGSKLNHDTDYNYKFMDKKCFETKDVIFNRETKAYYMLSSLQTEKDRLARLLSHPQVGGFKVDVNFSEDNQNVNKNAEISLKNSSVLWSTLEGTNNNDVTTKDLIEKFKEKLQFCQYYLKKEKETNEACKEEFIKLTEQLQKDLKLTRANLETLKSQERILHDHTMKAEEAKDKIQKDFKVKTDELSSYSEVIKTLSIKNNQLKEQSNNSQKQIKLLAEKITVLDYISKARNKMYEEKLKDLLNAACENLAKVKKSKTLQTEDRLLNGMSKYQLVLVAQDLLKKIIEKSEEVIQLEILLKKKTLLLEKITFLCTAQQSTFKKKKTEITQVNTQSLNKNTPSSPVKVHFEESDTSCDDLSENEPSQIYQKPENLIGATKTQNKQIAVSNEATSKTRNDLSFKCCNTPSHHSSSCLLESYKLCHKSNDCKQLIDLESLQVRLQKATARNSPVINTAQSFKIKDLPMLSSLGESKKINDHLSNLLNKKDGEQSWQGNSQDSADLAEGLLLETSRATPFGQSLTKRWLQPAKDRPDPDFQCPKSYRRSQPPKDIMSEEMASSDYETSVTTIEYLTENSSQEASVPSNFLKHDTSTYLKSQKLKSDRSPQKNSLSLFKNAELYVILKGCKKK